MALSLARFAANKRSLASAIGAGIITPGAGGGVLVPPPSGFGWDFAAHPVSVYKDGARHFRTDIDLKAKLNPAIWSGPAFYVSETGDNANPGTEASPVRSPWKARQLGEANPAGGYKVVLLGQPDRITYWGLHNNFNDTGGASGSPSAKPTKPFALIGQGEHAMSSFVPGIAWTYDAASQTYSAFFEYGIAALIDVAGVTRIGDFTLANRIPRIAGGADLAATRALVGASAGRYAFSASDKMVVVRMASDKVPGDATIKGCLAVDALNVGAVDTYISNLALVVGAGLGTLAIYDQATRNVIVEDATLLFAGVDAGLGRAALQADNTNGFIGLNRVRAVGSFDDLFNFMSNTGNLHALMNDCEGIGAGRDGANPTTQSNQILTLHQDVKLISTNTKGELSAGGCVRNINTSQQWDLGSHYKNDEGDGRFGGPIPSTGVLMQDTAKYWGDCITVEGCEFTFTAGDASQIRLRDPVEIGGLRGYGDIAAY